MMELVTADIGGTHARFAIAVVEHGEVASIGDPATYRTADHDGLEGAWARFAAEAGRPLPRAAAIAMAAKQEGDRLVLTNGGWTVRPGELRGALRLDELTLLNDFGAVAHAVAAVGPEWLRHLGGPDRPLPGEGVVSIVGPGTGLGVAQLVRRGGRDHVVETEGGHIAFAPLDPVEDSILAHLRCKYGRVSVERVVSGMGLADILEGMGGDANGRDDRALWTAAMTGEDPAAARALDRFCLSLGSVAGDIALAQGAQAVVIAGGIGLRLAERLPGSGFGERFVAKGRFSARMEAMPIKLLTYPQPGLLGAAAAFARAHAQA